MSFQIFWRDVEGVLTITTLIADQSHTACEDAVARLIASGKRTSNEFAGIFDKATLPPAAYSPAWRVSADTVVVKLDLARALRHRQLAHTAAKRLEDLQPLLMDAIIDNDPTARDRLRTRRDQLRQLIAMMPAEVANAANLSALDAVSPTILNDPLL